METLVKEVGIYLIASHPSNTRPPSPSTSSLPGRYGTLVLQLKRPPVLPSAASLAPKVLGRSTFLNWPLMHEARVVGISDEHEVKQLVAAACFLVSTG